MAFYESMEVGKQAERYAERYFKKHNMKYEDVREEKAYQAIDVDYLVEGLGKVEVKQNYHDAQYGKEGKFFWIELEVGNKQGWWYFTKADYFLFFNGERNGIIIKHDEGFRNIVDRYISNGDHSKSGESRIDIVPDERWDRYIPVTNMRMYLETLEVSLEHEGIEITKIVKRRKVLTK
jgi:hypothetical protein